MSPDSFSPLERSFLDEENWFLSMRILEQHPELASEDFSRRLTLAAESSGDEGEAHLLRESSRIVERVVAVGVEEAVKEKLGEGGVLAGLAREARDRYYESRDPKELLQSVDQFTAALLCDDDPLVYDQGRTLQGFGATLTDLAAILPDPVFNHVGCLAFLASTTAHLASMTPYDEEGWSDRLARLVSGIRSHLDRLDSLPSEESLAEFYASVRRACQLMDESVEEGAEGFMGLLEASFPVLSVALSSARAKPPLPCVSPPRDARLQQAAEAWRDIVSLWIERYGSDCFRTLIASPLPHPLEEAAPGPAAPISGRRFEHPRLDDLLAKGNEAYRPEGPITPARGVLALLVTATLGRMSDPVEARARLEMAERLLDQAEDPSEGISAGESVFHTRAKLASLAAATDAFLRVDVGNLERFQAARAALPIELLEEMASAVEADLAGLPSEVPESAPPAMEAAAQAAICLRDPVDLLAAIANDLGLPDAARYRGILDRLNDLLFGRSLTGTSIRVEEGTPGLAEMSDLVARFEAGPGTIEEADREELCNWLAATYEAGRVSFADTDAELTFLINLSWLYLQAWHEDTLKWASRARRLALGEGVLMDAATADVNAASFYLELLRIQPPWSVDVERASGRLFALIGALSHALEALRITHVGLKLSNPEDRFHVTAAGYGEVRALIEELLFEARDPSLLTEYLLNARGMWFLLDLYDAAAGTAGDAPERPVVSWRRRSWLAQSLPVDDALSTDDFGTAAAADVAEILSPGREPQALWFGSMLADDRATVASALIVPPNAFATTFEEYPATLAEAGEVPCLEVAALLGQLLPGRMWELADALREAGERWTLFVSPDPGLPPVSMGMWRHPGEGLARVLADAFDVVYCPTLAPREGAVPWVEEERAAAPEAFVVCDPLGDLPEARAVPKLARSVCGNARGEVRPPADRRAVLGMIDECARADGILVYQGHSESGAIDRPDAACLLLEPTGPSEAVSERLGIREMLHGVHGSSSGGMPRRAAFLSCASGAATTPYDATALAMAALTAGSDAVVSTLQPIADADWGEEVLDEMVDALRSPRPWKEFATWQGRAARVLETVEHEEVRLAVSSLAMFGAPFS